ncbi:MAG: alpha-ribazole phosphatase [Breznakibacter sp.]
MKTIYLIRHTTPNVGKGICYGATDLPLAETFAAERNEIKSKLDGFEPEMVFTSPLSRCTLLANGLFGYARTMADDRLKELDFGRWEMKRWDELDQEIFQKWADGFWDTAAPGGESFAMLYDRVVDAWQNAVIPDSHDRIAVVCHSGVIRSLLMALLDIPHSKIFNLELAYGAVLKLTWHDGNSYQLQFV